MKYEVAANVGGKLAQVGSRLVDGAARKFADDFFASFKQALEEGQSLEAPPSEAVALSEGGRAKPMVWIVVVAALIAVAMFFM